MKPAKRLRVRNRLLKRAKCRCAYCARPLTILTMTIDHVIPKALGGTGAQHNLRCACWDCNQAKADKPPHVFLNEIAQGIVR